MKEVTLLNDEPLGQKLITKSFWLYLFVYLAAPASYLIRVIISNSISVEEVGVLYSVIGFVSLVSIYNDLGLTETLKYFLPTYWIKKQYDNVKTVIILSLGAQLSTALILIALFWWGAPWLAEHYFHSESALAVLRIFCVFFLGKNAYEVLSSIFLSFQDTYHGKLIELIRTRAMMIFIGTLFLIGNGSIITYAYAWVGGLFIALAAAGVFFWRNYEQLIYRGSFTLDKPTLHQYTKYALRVFIGTNAANLLSYVDQQMIVVLLNPEYAGYYANYSSLFLLSSVVIGPILGLMLPLVTELITKNEIAQLTKLQDFMFTYVTILSLSIAGFMVSLGPEIATTFFGQKFVASGQLLTIGGMFIVVDILLSIGLSILTGMGQIQKRVKIVALVGVANVIMNYIFMQRWGVYGVIYASIISSIIMLWYTLIIIHSVYPIRVQRQLILQNGLLIAALSSCIYLVKGGFFQLIDSYRIMNVVWLGVAGISYYVLFGAYNWRKVRMLKNELVSMRNSMKSDT